MSYKLNKDHWTYKLKEDEPFDLEIVNYDRYNSKKYVGKGYFTMMNTLPHSRKIRSLKENLYARWLYVILLCEASHEASPKLTVTLQHLRHLGGSFRTSLREAIFLLEQVQLVTRDFCIVSKRVSKIEKHTPNERTNERTNERYKYLDDGEQPHTQLTTHLHDTKDVEVISECVLMLEGKVPSSKRINLILEKLKDVPYEIPEIGLAVYNYSGYMDSCGYPKKTNLVSLVKGLTKSGKPFIETWINNDSWDKTLSDEEMKKQLEINKRDVEAYENYVKAKKGGKSL